MNQKHEDEQAQPEPQPQEYMMDRREVARVVYDEYKTQQRSLSQIAAEYGKWLVTTLVLLHGGALFGMFTLLAGNRVTEDYQLTIWCLAVGLILALLSGFFSWLNFSLHAENYAYQADPEMLWNGKKWLRDRLYVRSLDVTYWAAIASGFGSAALLLAATHFFPFESNFF